MIEPLHRPSIARSIGMNEATGRPARSDHHSLIPAIGERLRMKHIASIDGTILRGSEAVIPIDDLGLQRGYAAFDYARVTNGKIFRFHDHLERFRRSAEALHLAFAYTDDDVASQAMALVRDIGIPNPGLRLLLTGGSAYARALLERPRFIMIAEELPLYPETVYADGAKLATYEFQRDLPRVKTTNYLTAFRLDSYRQQHGAFTMLYHWNGMALECPRDNFFIVRGNTLVTPARNVLMGITRKIVLELAAGTFDVEERGIRIEELERADEAFITSTTKRIVPVVRIDDRPVGTGSVGSRTRAIMERFRDYERTY
jgi:branched-chain amino acid aminotransferase